MKWILSFLLLVSIKAVAQHSYIIAFKDKQGTPYSIDNPREFLSARAIERRAKHKIAISENDLPVSPVYIQQVVATGAAYLNASKWLNQIAVQTDDPQVLARIVALPFVKGADLVKRRTELSPVERKFKVSGGAINYGNSRKQIEIHEGQFLHDLGFTGKGLMVGIIDAGFYRYTSLPVFDSVNAKMQVVDTYDFVRNVAEVTDQDAHGMQCFSVMAANIPGKFTGSAPDATYLLYRSEDVKTESRLEEQNWIAALERADSTGADLVTTSLGYNTFDNPAFDYTYSQLNGKISLMARAATIAARKGILLLVAAGNEGAKEWKMITTPADADSVISVGAVDTLGNPAGFSSYGPTADGRVAPLVASVGVATTISLTDGSIGRGNGTSFATPNLAGLITCLWQAFPEFNNMQILEAVKNSSSNRSQPDNRIGFGIPSFKIAYEILLQLREQQQADTLAGDRMVIYPNPATNKISVRISSSGGKGKFFLYNMKGQLVYEKSFDFTPGALGEVTLQLPDFPTGMYILQFVSGKNRIASPLIISK